MPEPEPENHFDPNCLHCVVSPLVEIFCKEHLDKGAELCIRELATVVGELIGASIVYGSQMPEDAAVDALSNLAALATGQIVQSATLFLYRRRAELADRTEGERKLS
jgi:hypothetical protein